MTQTIAYGEYHIANLPIVHGFIVVIDNDTGTVIKSYEGLATGEDGSQKAIGFLPSDKIQAYSRNGLPNVYSSEYPLQELYTGSSSDVSKLLAIGDNTVTAINNANIGYPILGLVPTDKTTGVSNSNSVISIILKSMNLPDPGPTSGTAPGQDTMLLNNDQINQIRQGYGFSPINYDGDSLLSRDGDNYDYKKMDENGVTTYEIKYDDGSTTKETVYGTVPTVYLDSTDLEVTNSSSASFIGSNSLIQLDDNVHSNISGSGDTISLAAGSGRDIGIFGQNQTVTGDSGDNGVNLGGDGTTATVSGGGYVGLVNNDEAVTLTDAGSSVLTAAGVQNESITANSSSITLAAGALANITGTNDGIHFQGDSNETIGITGQGLTVDGDSGNDVVNLNANTSATVDGGGYAGIVGSGATLTFGDGGSSLQTTPGVTNETVNGSNLSITLNANVQMTINGSNDTINGMAGGDNVTINGSYKSFSGNNDQVDLEGDVGSDSGTGENDSYFSDGTYVGGSDGSGGFDGPGDPEDPGDGGDDDDPLVLNLRGGSVQTVGAAQSSARFDFHHDGQAVRTGWGTPGEGYLVDAANGQTTVKDGSDLVSSFMSLQKLDSNHDDRIDAQDAHWNDLKVWVDGTGTAAFQPGSLRSLSDLGITAIDLDPTPDRHRQNGNMILAQGTFTRSDGSTGQIADVDFGTAAGGAHLRPSAPSAATAHLQVAAQAAQLVSAMSTFGATAAAETHAPALDRPAFVPLGVETTQPSHRHAA